MKVFLHIAIDRFSYTLYLPRIAVLQILEIVHIPSYLNIFVQCIVAEMHKYVAMCRKKFDVCIKRFLLASVALQFIHMGGGIACLIIYNIQTTK